MYAPFLISVGGDGGDTRVAGSFDTVDLSLVAFDQWALFGISAPAVAL
jgi:hypothetical protein